MVWRPSVLKKIVKATMFKLESCPFLLLIARTLSNFDIRAGGKLSTYLDPVFLLDKIVHSKQLISMELLKHAGSGLHNSTFLHCILACASNGT